jgi:DNA invertase Pin-like site-specific DNA recombinase
MQHCPATTPVDDFSSRAAMYARMSTEHQKYSIENQSSAIQLYADQIGVSIVERYADKGVSGLTYEKRDALKRLIETVITGIATFKHILVYDVSRWGRFQDIDESAYYEYMCHKSGIKVHYIAEQFQNDGTSLSAIIKSIKRIMAAEYSRELSVKTYAGKCHVATKGLHIGGPPPYGLRRGIVDQDGTIIKILKLYERKAFPSSYTKLVPGPKEERQVVKLIFRLFVKSNFSQSQIAKMLNDKGYPKGYLRTWSTHTVCRILRSEKYIGNLVMNKTTQKLGTKIVYNPSSSWLHVNNVIEPTVGKEIFMAAQKKIEEFNHIPSNQELLEALKKLLKKRGNLSFSIINLSSEVPSATLYRERFGSLKQAYQLIGYEPKTSKTRGPSISLTWKIGQAIEQKLIKKIQHSKVEITKISRFIWQIQGKLTLSVIVCYPTRWLTKTGSFQYWGYLGPRKGRIDMIVAVCMSRKSSQPKYFYLFPPSILRAAAYLRFPNMFWTKLEKYNYKTLEKLSTAILKKTRTA